MGAVLVLVQGSQPQGTYMACNVVAGGDRVVADGVGADEADLDVAVCPFVLSVVLNLEIGQLPSIRWLSLIAYRFARRFGRWIVRAMMRPSPPPSPTAASSTSSSSASVTVPSGP